MHCVIYQRSSFPEPRQRKRAIRIRFAASFRQRFDNESSLFGSKVGQMTFCGVGNVCNNLKPVRDRQLACRVTECKKRDGEMCAVCCNCNYAFVFNASLFSGRITLLQGLRTFFRLPTEIVAAALLSYCRFPWRCEENKFRSN